MTQRILEQAVRGANVMKRKEGKPRGAKEGEGIHSIRQRGKFLARFKLIKGFKA